MKYIFHSWIQKLNIIKISAPLIAVYTFKRTLVNSTRILFVCFMDCKNNSKVYLGKYVKSQKNYKIVKRKQLHQILCTFLATIITCMADILVI